MSARRCSTCNINWPDFVNEFGICASCRTPTSVMPSAEPITIEEARRAARSFEFDRFSANETDEQREKRQQEADLTESEQRADAIVEREQAREREIRETKREFLRIVKKSWSLEERRRLEHEGRKLPLAHTWVKPDLNAE